MKALKIKLTYFEFRARAEIIRILLNYGGLPFEDKKIKRDDWPEFKPSKLIFPFMNQQNYKKLIQSPSAARGLRYQKQPFAS